MRKECETGWATNIQFVSTNPNTRLVSSKATSLPRISGRLVSLCHIGIVVVLTPIPKPETTLPTIICAIVKEVACSSPPMTSNTQPKTTDLRRPSRSPVKIVRMAPKMHPNVYVDTIWLWMVAFGWLNCFRKEGFDRRPPKTPWS